MSQNTIFANLEVCKMLVLHNRAWFACCIFKGSSQCIYFKLSKDENIYYYNFECCNTALPHYVIPSPKEKKVLWQHLEIILVFIIKPLWKVLKVVLEMHTVLQIMNYELFNHFVKSFNKVAHLGGSEDGGGAGLLPPYVLQFAL